MSDPNATYQPAAPTVVRLQFVRPGPRAWLRIEAAAVHATVIVNGIRVGEHLGAWTPFEFEISAQLRDRNEVEIHCEDRYHFTQGFLPVIGLRWTGVAPRYDCDPGAPNILILKAPSPATVPASQRSTVRGTQLLVDGRPFRVRGILHWGYYPELRTPWPSEPQMRREIADLKSLGFNLIKFCLWAPPRRYYELCDELGMLVWQEYPVWNAPLGGAGTPQYHRALHAAGGGTPTNDAILAEFRELFLRDRQYACIILRTMTCENDHVAPEISRKLVDLAHELIPGCLALDNSGWLCNEQTGDFHDEHPYVHNAQWVLFAQRMRGRLHKPLLLGETMVADTLNPAYAAALNSGNEAEILAHANAAALAVRRFQIETLARDMPDVGYVICGLRDLEETPLGIYAHDGRLKYRPEEWSWHGSAPQSPQSEPQAPARGYLRETANFETKTHALALGARTDSDKPDEPVQPPLGGILGPRKGAWKCRDNNWWSPIVRILDKHLPASRIEREVAIELLSGRVPTHAQGTRVLVEQIDVHAGELKRNPLVIEFRSEGQWRITSSLRHDTPAGRELWRALRHRIDNAQVAPPPEIGPLIGNALVLENWQVRIDGQTWEVHSAAPEFDARNLPRDGWIDVKCDTPLVNAGRTLFEGWATFRAALDHPGGKRTHHCESIADYYELYIDGALIAAVGPKHGTWDGTRDAPRDFELDLPAGRHEIVLRVRDWRAAGALAGPIYLATNPNERIF